MARERPPYLYVFCRTTQTTHGFVRGTTAGDAVRIIQNQFHLLVLHIEAVYAYGSAVKPPIVFGPDVVLDDINDMWQLETFTEGDEITRGGYFREVPSQKPKPELEESTRPEKKEKLEESTRINDSTEQPKPELEESTRPEKKKKLEESNSTEGRNNQVFTYYEVFCKSSNTIRRFTKGTTAGFAVSVINGKRKHSEAHTLHIEAVKEGEEPIVFGPDSVLGYSKGWKLQTFTQVDDSDSNNIQT